jgi:signal transduction histidine kinase
MKTVDEGYASLLSGDVEIGIERLAENDTMRIEKRCVARTESFLPIMTISSDLQRLCLELDKFQIATAIGHVSKDVFLHWNRSFARRLGLDESEVETVELRKIIAPDLPTEEASGRPEGSAPAGPFSDCVVLVRVLGEERQILGESVRREDGFILVILDHVSGAGTMEYARGYLVGQEKERQRAQQVVHDNVSGTLIAASLVTENAKQKLEDEGRPEAEDLKRIGSLIDKAINDLVNAFTFGPSIVEA